MTPRFGTFALLASLLVAAPLHAASRPPNVVLIFADDLGYADVGCYRRQGLSRRRTSTGSATRGRPLHRLLRRPGRLLRVAGGPADRLLPQPRRHPRALGPGSQDRHRRRRDDDRRGAQADAATRPAIFGKWHLGHHPQFLPTQARLRRVLRPALLERHVAEPPEAKHGAVPAAPADRRREDDRRRRPTRTRRSSRRGTPSGRSSFIEREQGPAVLPLRAAQHAARAAARLATSSRASRKRGLYGDVIEEIDWSVGPDPRRAEATRPGRETRWCIFTLGQRPVAVSYGDHAGSAGPLREGKGTTCGRAARGVPLP